MASLPLTRTACLDDYQDCVSVAVWQQCHAIEAYQAWLGAPFVGPAGEILCYNWGAAYFRAPGPTPIYRGFRDPDDVTAPLSAIFALSVLDRVDAPRFFLHTVARRLLPEGLLVCTFAAWNATGEDCAIGHELRQRIYDRQAWAELIRDMKRAGLQPFGGVDLRYRGDTLGDHTLGVLTLKKEDR